MKFLIKNYFHSFQAIEEMMKNVRKQFRESLEDLQWMDYTTRQIAKAKVDCMVDIIGTSLRFSGLLLYFKNCKEQSHRLRTRAQHSCSKMRPCQQKSGSAAKRNSYSHNTLNPSSGNRMDVMTSLKNELMENYPD